MPFCHNHLDGDGNVSAWGALELFLQCCGDGLRVFTVGINQNDKLIGLRIVSIPRGNNEFGRRFRREPWVNG